MVFNSYAPKVRSYWRQNLCLDKGYDFNEVRGLAEEFGYTTHIRARGEEAAEIKRSARFKARRWPENYLGMLHLVCAVITIRCAEVLG